MRLPQFTAELSLSPNDKGFQQRRQVKDAPLNDVVPAYYVRTEHTIWWCNDKMCIPIQSVEQTISGYVMY